MCGGSGRIQDFKQVQETNKTTVQNEEGFDEEIEETELVEQMDENECELWKGFQNDLCNIFFIWHRTRH